MIKVEDLKNIEKNGVLQVRLNGKFISILIVDFQFNKNDWEVSGYDMNGDIIALESVDNYELIACHPFNHQQSEYRRKTQTTK